MLPTDEHMRVEAPETCPPPGTLEYGAYIERQAGGAFIDAMNFHPILRVLSTIVILIYGGGPLFFDWEELSTQPSWFGLLGCVTSVVYEIPVFLYLRYSWGRRRRDSIQQDL